MPRWTRKDPAMRCGRSDNPGVDRRATRMANGALPGRCPLGFLSPVATGFACVTQSWARSGGLLVVVV